MYPFFHWFVLKVVRVTLKTQPLKAISEFRNHDGLFDFKLRIILKKKEEYLNALRKLRTHNVHLEECYLNLSESHQHGLESKDLLQCKWSGMLPPPGWHRLLTKAFYSHGCCAIRYAIGRVTTGSPPWQFCHLNLNVRRCYFSKCSEKSRYLAWFLMRNESHTNLGAGLYEGSTVLVIFLPVYPPQIPWSSSRSTPFAFEWYILFRPRPHQYSRSFVILQLNGALLSSARWLLWARTSTKSGMVMWLFSSCIDTILLRKSVMGCQHRHRLGIQCPGSDQSFPLPYIRQTTQTRLNRRYPCWSSVSFTRTISAFLFFVLSKKHTQIIGSRLLPPFNHKFDVAGSPSLASMDSQRLLRAWTPTLVITGTTGIDFIIPWPRVQWATGQSSSGSRLHIIMSVSQWWAAPDQQFFCIDDRMVWRRTNFCVGTTCFGRRLAYLHCHSAPYRRYREEVRTTEREFDEFWPAPLHKTCGRLSWIAYLFKGSREILVFKLEYAKIQPALKTRRWVNDCPVEATGSPFGVDMSTTGPIRTNAELSVPGVAARKPPPPAALDEFFSVSGMPLTIIVLPCNLSHSVYLICTHRITSSAAFNNHNLWSAGHLSMTILTELTSILRKSALQIFLPSAENQ